jgi:quinol monooxygenase YgiN
MNDDRHSINWRFMTKVLKVSALEPGIRLPIGRSHMTGSTQTIRTGVIITFKARAGQRDALAAHLLSAAQSYAGEAQTELFTVNLSPIDPDAVIVIETYSSEAAKAAHEAAPGYPAIRAGTGAFLAGPPQVTPLLPLGGKGL